MKKIQVGIIYGGNSAEHEVSKISAQAILKAIDKSKYITTMIYISKNGQVDLSLITKQDVVFPITHGQNGEDGTLQGLLKFLQIPFVGAGVLGSAVSMDKDVLKRLLQHAGLPVTKFITMRDPNQFTPAKIIKELGLPLFVKPANQGSSFGISKVKNIKELKPAISFAFKYDNKILVEKFVPGREIECAVIGNEQVFVSEPGEIFPKGEFHDYDSKYADSKAQVPAKLTKFQLQEIKSLAADAYKTLECAGMARVDFFLTPKGKFIINELNTIPGFTGESMFPKLMQASGVGFSKLIDKLIDLALK